jgi:cytochrome c556
VKHYVIAGFLGLVLILPAWAENALPADPRISLGMTPEERAEFLSEMRQMLGSIQGILQGIASENRKMIADSASLSGNRMARATPDALRNRLPQTFKAIGGPTHLLFEELVIRAETDDMDMLLQHTTGIMGQCMSCHAQFRAD